MYIVSMWRRAWPVRRRLRLLCMSGERARFITEQAVPYQLQFRIRTPSRRGKAKGSGALSLTPGTVTRRRLTSQAPSMYFVGARCDMLVRMPSEACVSVNG